jgi:hypothetical protein
VAHFKAPSAAVHKLSYGFSHPVGSSGTSVQQADYIYKTAIWKGGILLVKCDVTLTVVFKLLHYSYCVCVIAQLHYSYSVCVIAKLHYSYYVCVIAQFHYSYSVCVIAQLNYSY